MRLDSLGYICCPSCKGELSLTIDEQTENEVIQGTLECSACGGRFEIKDGLANLMFPEILEGSDLSSQTFYDQRPKYDYRPTAFRLGIWEVTFRWTWLKRRWSNRLEVSEGDSILETGVGNGDNLVFIGHVIGKSGRLDGLDISSESLMVAREKMRRIGIRTELIQGNASYLPYKSEKFDAVLHVGGLNEFGDKKRAIEEMHRVAKSGAKIVICDEGLSPDREKTLLGKYILKCSKLYAHKPPVKLLPEGIEDLKLYWIDQGTSWVIEYRKGL